MLTANGPSGPVPDALATGPGGTDVVVEVTGARNAKGMIRACLSRDPRFFPHCEKDKAALKASVPAAPAARLHFAAVAPGDYAITVLHDENENFRADMLFGIPREGVGFSRNPVLRMGPPSFDAARFRVEREPVVQRVVLKYFL